MDLNPAFDSLFVLHFASVAYDFRARSHNWPFYELIRFQTIQRKTDAFQDVPVEDHSARVGLYPSAGRDHSVFADTFQLYKD